MHEIESLKTALSMMVGVEAMVVLRDVLRLDHAQAKAAGERAVREMVRAVRHRRGERPTGPADAASRS